MHIDEAKVQRMMELDARVSGTVDAIGDYVDKNQQVPDEVSAVVTDAIHAILNEEGRSGFFLILATAEFLANMVAMLAAKGMAADVVLGAVYKVAAGGLSVAMSADEPKH